MSKPLCRVRSIEIWRYLTLDCPLMPYSPASLASCKTLNLQHPESRLPEVANAQHWVQVAPHWGQVPPRWGQVPPRWGQVPPCWGQVPPRWRQVPPQSTAGNMQQSSSRATSQGSKGQTHMQRLAADALQYKVKQYKPWPQLSCSKWDEF